MLAIPEDLLIAYQNTDYIVHAAPEFTLHISKYSAPFLKLANLQKCKSAVFITAHNPYSNIKSPKQNQAAQDQLRAQAIQNGWKYFEGVGQSKDQSWKEDSLFIFGLNRKRALDLCGQHHQQAVVWVDERAIPELIFSTVSPNSGLSFNTNLV